MSAGSDLRPSVPLPESLTREYLENYLVLPLSLREGRLRVAAAGDPDPQALDDLALLFDAEPEVVAVDESILRDAIRRAMDENTRVVELLDPGDAVPGLPNGADDLTADVRDLATQPPVIRYVSLLLRDAHAAGASDVHLESIRDGLRVRFRVDGVLSDGDSPPRELAQAVISRVKLLANLDIAERRMPQDGRIRVRLEDRELDLRVSTLPALHGESVVLRLLDRGGRPAALDQLGMNAETYEAFGALARRPHGIVLVTGPTGSGKTTTLHAALGLRDATQEKIVTVEDPIEYQLPGIIQIPVNPKAGTTFATALRGVLRHDPDVVMVGEMRDQETASIAIDIHIPPLRDRRSDIAELARAFLAAAPDGRGRRLGTCAEAMLMEWDWPGNVRELEWVMVRASVCLSGSTILADELRPLLGGTSGTRPDRPRHRPALSPMPDRSVELRGDRQRLSALLTGHGGYVALAARAAGVPRTTLLRWLQEVGLTGRAPRGRPNVAVQDQENVQWTF